MLSNRKAYSLVCAIASDGPSPRMSIASYGPYASHVPSFVGAPGGEPARIYKICCWYAISASRKKLYAPIAELFLQRLNSLCSDIAFADEIICRYRSCFF